MRRRLNQLSVLIFSALLLVFSAGSVLGYSCDMSPCAPPSSAHAHSAHAHSSGKSTPTAHPCCPSEGNCEDAGSFSAGMAADCGAQLTTVAAVASGPSLKLQAGGVIVRLGPEVSPGLSGTGIHSPTQAPSPIFTNKVYLLNLTLLR